MKQTRIIFGVLILLLLAGCATQQERAARKARERQAVAEALASKHLHIDVWSMSPMRYPSRTVTPDFFLELNGDMLRSYLPYLGRAYQASIGTPSIGLDFESRVLRYSESRPKSNCQRIELDVKTDEDTHHYMIDVYDSGEAHISVRSLNRDPISFVGSVRTE